jgi:hypothetical protein
LLQTEAEFSELAGVQDLLDCLQLGEVIAFADGAERRVELRGFKVAFRQEVADFLIPRVFEVEILFRLLQSFLFGISLARIEVQAA